MPGTHHKVGMTRCRTDICPFLREVKCSNRQPSCPLTASAICKFPSSGIEAGRQFQAGRNALASISSGAPCLGVDSTPRRGFDATRRGFDATRRGFDATRRGFDASLNNWRQFQAGRNASAWIRRIAKELAPILGTCVEFSVVVASSPKLKSST